MKTKSFRELLSLRRDGKISSRESETLERLLREDQDLANEAQNFAQALDLLKAARYDEVEPTADFNGRVLRRHRVETRRRSFESWFPAVIGAITAAVGLVAMIQVVSGPVGPVQTKFSQEKAELETTDYPVIPGLSE